MSASCKICGHETVPFDSVDRGKSCAGGRFPLGVTGEAVLYCRCPDCGFIQTNAFDDWAPADWAANIYNEDYLTVDPCYVERRPMASRGLIASQFKRSSTIGLDYGAGSGLMARSLREAGWRFDACEPYGDSSMEPQNKGLYNVCSSIEVFEHTVDPVSEMGEIVRLCSKGRLMVVIGTNLSDGEVDEDRRLAWWYAAPRNGHISLFSRESLRRLAVQFGLEFTSFGASTHYLTRGWHSADVARMAYIGKARRMLRLA